ncbi:MAG: Rpn family recombination-promoting nuclease/putative transposase [Victivallales bacterium]|nr:Rpn family recombination-promoting nuclease/putative transposase [Victivallales bacterium]
MGKKDSATKVMMKRREMFVDAFNILFRRAGITVDLDSLEERDPALTIPVNIGDQEGWVDRANDVAFEAVVRRIGETDCVMLCVENQSEVEHDMPLRNLITSGFQWWKYKTQLSKTNKKAKKLKKGDFLSGFLKNDRLPPVVIMVLYLGLEPWTGPSRFQEIVDAKIPEMRHFMADCPTNVVSLVDLTAEELSHMKSPLRILAKLLQTHGDKEAMLRVAREDPMFRDAPAIIFRVFNELTNSKLTIPRKKEHNNMCKALDDLKEEGRQLGHKESEAKIRRIEEKAKEKIRKVNDKAKAERDKAKAERDKAIHSLINVFEELGQPFEKTRKYLMERYKLSQKQVDEYIQNHRRFDSNILFNI